MAIVTKKSIKKKQISEKDAKDIFCEIREAKEKRNQKIIKLNKELDGVFEAIDRAGEKEKLSNIEKQIQNY